MYIYTAHSLYRLSCSCCAAPRIPFLFSSEVPPRQREMWLQPTNRSLQRLIHSHSRITGPQRCLTGNGWLRHALTVRTQLPAKFLINHTNTQRHEDFPLFFFSRTATLVPVIRGTVSSPENTHRQHSRRVQYIILWDRNGSWTCFVSGY